jgi:hypothetical protein
VSALVIRRFCGEALPFKIKQMIGGDRDRAEA